MEKHISIKITGKVQGVGFRYYTKQLANELFINGFVKNEYDGSVYIEASGKAENIEQFVHWCYKGPKWARVENVQISEKEISKFEQFLVK